MSRVHDIVAAWVGAIQKMATTVTVLLLLAAGFGLNYTATHLGVFTDAAAMLSDKLPFRRSYERYRRAFPQHVDMILVVVDGVTPERADAASAALADAMAHQKEIFTDVYQPDSEPFFIRNAFLFLDTDDLYDLVDRLAAVQPFIGLLNRDPSLTSLGTAIGEALKSDGVPVALERFIEDMARALASRNEKVPYDVSWQRLLGDETGDQTYRRYLYLKPIAEFNEPLAVDRAVVAIREAARELDLTPATGVRIRLTGDAMLYHEELSAAMEGMEVAIIFTVVLITGVLLAGLRSVWLVLATFVNLGVGLIYTATFAALAVGHLNLISIAFAVLYIGLGVDYAIHLSLRYMDMLRSGVDKKTAIRSATARVGSPLLLCTLTTAIAFYAFVPTSFTGVSELGLISGTGMFINFFLSMTLLPAMLSLLPAPRHLPRKGESRWLNSAHTLVRRHARGICIAALLPGIAALFLVPGLRFDRNTLNLRPADSESVATLRELMARSQVPLMSITVLAPDAQSSQALVRALRTLPEVRGTATAEDLVPPVDDEKLAAIAELDLLMGSSLDQHPSIQPRSIADETEALEYLEEKLISYADRAKGAARDRALRLAMGIESFMHELGRAAPPAQAAMLGFLRTRWLGNLPVNARRLKLALQPDASETLELPAAIRDRWVSAEGVRRIAVFPRDDINDDAALRRFVESVQALAPDATDEPVLNVRAGDAVVGAFRQAFLGAIVTIVCILLVLVRNLRATLLILAPLVLAALLTAGVMVLAGIPLNFANVIALPLLFGIGVDNGIHMVQRAREDKGAPADPLASSTARGVLFSSLTTMCGFGSLLLSKHPGTVSIGLVLSIGLAITLVCSLIVLPALLRCTNATNNRCTS